MYSSQEVKKRQYQSALHEYMREGDFLLTLTDALETGYLSEGFLAATTILRVENFTRPAEILSDAERPVLHLLEPKLADIKQHMRVLVEAGIALSTILEWTREAVATFNQPVLKLSTEEDFSENNK